MILLLTIVVGYSGFSSLRNVVSETDFYSSIDEVKNSFTVAAAYSDRYLLYNYSEGRSSQADAIKKFQTNIKDCKKQTDSVIGKKNTSQDIDTIVKKIRKEIDIFEKNFNQLTTVENSKSNDADALFTLFADIEKNAQWFDTVKAGIVLIKADCEGYFQRTTDAKWNVILEHLKSLDKAVKNWEEQNGTNKMMNKMFAPVKDGFLKVEPLLKQYQASVLTQGEISGALDQSKTAVNKSLLEVRDISFKKMDTERRNSNIVILISVLGAVLVGLFYGTMTTRAIVRPVRRVVNGLKDIAEGEGDLTRRLNVNSNDEVGELAANFNRFIERIHAMMQDMSHNAMSLDGASSELKAIAEVMFKDSGEANQKASAVASTSKDLSINMNSVAAAMEEASNSINTVSAAAEEMTVTINEIAKSSANVSKKTSVAVSRTSVASKEMEKLGEAAMEIGKVVETITAISDMVNLLALNATIEAARAGEAGRGFAVVANEIKELARQTSGASGEIKEKVSGIQSVAQKTIEHITEIGKEVNEINDMINIIASSVEEQSATTSEIAGNVSQISTGIGDVNQNVSHSSEGVAGITREITTVTSISNHIANNSNKINESASCLSDMAGSLKSVVGKFRI
ncbi:MAG: methyl-accepting chemotaxis protein [Desulfamplus sp.]|nr:methyl-accepting chemotaxis protein [Desulfamplus sp.]